MIDRTRLLHEIAQRSTEVHEHFLDLRKTTLEQVESLLKLQMQTLQVADRPLTKLPNNENMVVESRPLFDSNQLSEFAKGSLTKCFGPDLAAYKGRRFPRIPNGELALISRVISIDGEKRQFNRPAHIICEYDVPTDAWFFQDKGDSEIPFSILMEIALQPCGFLSAYLGTPTLCPDEDFFFRNLDGRASLVSRGDQRGKTVTSHATLFSTLVSGGTIIQRFDFRLDLDGHTFFHGNAVFGYFSPEAMAKQVGLDSGKKIQPLYIRQSEKKMAGRQIDLTNQVNFSKYYNGNVDRPYYHLAKNHLNLVDRVFISEFADPEFPGYIYANKKVDPQDWFYRCHFFQDPVMPGSLGVEAILQALQVYALGHDLGRDLRSPRFHLVDGSEMTWRYRGQIIPMNQTMQLEANIVRVDRTPHRVTIHANAALWADDVRIYEVIGAAICLEDS